MSKWRNGNVATPTILLVNSLGRSLIVDARDDDVVLAGQMSSGDDQI